MDGHLQAFFFVDGDGSVGLMVNKILSKCPVQVSISSVYKYILTGNMGSS